MSHTEDAEDAERRVDFLGSCRGEFNRRERKERIENQFSASISGSKKSLTRRREDAKRSEKIHPS